MAAPAEHGLFGEAETLGDARKIEIAVVQIVEQPAAADGILDLPGRRALRAKPAVQRARLETEQVGDPLVPAAALAKQSIDDGARLRDANGAVTRGPDDISYRRPLLNRRAPNVVA